MMDNNETPAALLARLGQELKISPGVDADLAEIVVEHILTAAPAQNCVDQAMTAITALASVRATSPGENEND